jgi:asparaginyl-tRNA synthetase
MSDSTQSTPIPVVTIQNLSRHVDQEVELRGWLYGKRSKGKLAFLQMRDGTGFVQVVVVRAEVDEASWEAADRLTQEASCIVRGRVRADERAQGGFELGGTHVEVVHLPTQEYPISPKEHGVDFLMNHRHLWLRSRRQHAILRVRATIEQAIHDFFYDRDFVRIDTPILTPAACEGTTTLFETDYFEEKAFLTQSGQMYLEAACMAFGNVYNFGPTFRAEKSKTRRHLMEFWMVEAEMPYWNLAQNLELQEAFLRHVVGRVLERNRAELALLERDVTTLEKTVASTFPRITYDEALARLQAAGSDITFGEDFGNDDEDILARQFETPFFVTHYPAAIKAFYMDPDPERPDRALCADMLAPEGYGEIIGGSQRISDPDLLRARFEEHELTDEAYGWYMDLRRYGTVPHAGFGLGIERTIRWICGLEHIRECIPFPRLLTRIYP